MKKLIPNSWIFLVLLIGLILGGVYEVLAQSAPATPWGDVIIYGSNGYPTTGYSDREILTLNLTQETYQHVGTAVVPNQALAQDPVTGYLYYFESTTSGDDFAYWNPTTSSNTIVRHYAPTPGFYAKRMDFSPDGTLYMMDNDNRLYTLNKQTGDYSLPLVISGFPDDFSGETGDMAFAPDGTLYVATGESLYTVNMNTLTASNPPLFQNMLDLPAEKGLTVWTGLAYCDGQLYGSHAEQNTALSALFHINPTTGATTLMFYTDTLLNDLSSCQPRVKVCALAANQTYDFYIEPLTVTIKVNQKGNLDCIHMRRFNASHQQATLPLQTGYYWDIVGLNSSGSAATNFNVDLTLPAPFVPDASDKVCRRNESLAQWDCAFNSFNATSITRNGVTEFSSWTVGNNAGPLAVNLQSFTTQQSIPIPLALVIGLFVAASFTIGIFYVGIKRRI